MIFLFIFSCYYLFCIKVLAPIRHWRGIDPNIEDNSAHLSSIITTLHTTINLACLDGLIFILTGDSYMKKILSSDSKILLVLLILIPIYIIGAIWRNVLRNNRFKFPDWWNNIYGRIPLVLKLVLFLMVVLGQFYIMKLLITDYGYMKAD